jgi:hypothetical protein
MGLRHIFDKPGWHSRIASDLSFSYERTGVLYVWQVVVSRDNVRQAERWRLRVRY